MGPIAKSTIKTTFVLGLRLVVQAGTLLCVARMLGPEQFGAFAGVAALAVLMGAFATFGTHLVLLGEVSKDPACRTDVLTYAVPTTLITGSFLFFAFLAACLWLFSSIQIPLSVFICIGLTEIILLPLFVLPATEQLAQEKTARSQLQMLFPLTLRSLAAIALLVAGSTQPLTVFSWLYLSTAVISLFFIWMTNKNSWLTVSEWKLASKQQLRNSAGYAALSMTAAAPGELDKVLASKLLPPEIGGLYSAASRIIASATYPVIALMLSALPRLFVLATHESDKNKKLVKWIFVSVFCYSFLLAGMLWLLSPLLEVIFGKKYEGMSVVLQWLCLAIPGMALRIAAGNVLISMSKPWTKALIDSAGVITLTFFALLFLQPLGNISLPIALAVSELIMAIVSISILLMSKNAGLYDKNEVASNH
jgi:O-antigen/teichoic acid export membrane protein